MLSRFESMIAAVLRLLLPVLLWSVSAAQMPAQESAQRPAFHVVARGDTLTSIARRYHLSVAALKAANGLTSDVIHPDQKLRLTAKGDAAPVPSAVPVARPVEPAPSPKTSSAQRLRIEDRLETLTSVDRLRLQVYLDGIGFAPGKVDGVTGEFTVKAARRWIEAAPERDFEALLRAATRAVREPTEEFVIPEEAASFVGEVPEDLEERAAAKVLPYTSLIEYVAERFHTDEAALSRLNAGKQASTFRIGATLRVPAVRPFRIEVGRLDGAAKERIRDASIRILHLEHQLEVCAGDGELLAVFPITVGTKPEYVRAGAWKIAAMVPNPNFVWDEEMLKHGKKGEKQYVLPPGPNNPVGVLWLELQPVSGPVAHIGIHGTNDPTHIGRNHSSGCIRLANWDVVRLCRLVGTGARVEWVPQPKAGAAGE